MSRRRNRNRKTMDSHPFVFSRVDLLDIALRKAKWLDNVHPLDFLSVEKVRSALNEASRGAMCELQWLWEQLEPADPILATCVDRRETALKKIPWSIVKKDGLTDAEDLLAEAQLRTAQDFANALENIEEAIAAFGQASFRAYRHIQLYETEFGNLRFNITDNWNWARDGYNGSWQWNPEASFGLTVGKPLPVAPESIITRVCPRPIDQPAMMLCLDRKNAKAQWLTYNGRYGVPPIFAIMPPGIDEATHAAYLKFANQCVSNAAGVLPSGSDVKAVTPGAGGPDTFKQALDMATQEIVLRATGGLMTMLTAPGAGTNTETGSSHQDAFDDLADAEAHEIAAIIQESVIVPILEQWHPGQPVLVEFVLKRPDRDDTGVAVQNITALAQTGYRVSDEDVQAMTGLKVNSANMDSTAIYAAKAAGYTPTLAAMEDRMGMPLKPVPVLEPSAVNSLEKRYAPLMLWQPARDTFERACNARRGFIQEGEPLSEDELHAIHNLANTGLNPDQISADAARAADALENAIAQSADDDSGDDTAQNRDYKRADNGQFASTGAGNHAQKGGRASRGNPGAKRNKSNTPLKAARGAKLQAQVRAVQHALKATRKKGKVEGAYNTGHTEVDIESGHPDHFGRRHAQKHMHPGDASETKVAKSLILAPRKKSFDENKKKDGVTGIRKGVIAVVKHTKKQGKGKMNFNTGYKRRGKK